MKTITRHFSDDEVRAANTKFFQILPAYQNSQNAALRTITEWLMKNTYVKMLPAFHVTKRPKNSIPGDITHKKIAIQFKYQGCQGFWIFLRRSMKDSISNKEGGIRILFLEIEKKVIAIIANVLCALKYFHFFY